MKNIKKVLVGITFVLSLGMIGCFTVDDNSTIDDKIQEQTLVTQEDVKVMRCDICENYSSTILTVDENDAVVDSGSYCVDCYNKMKEHGTRNKEQEKAYENGYKNGTTVVKEEITTSTDEEITTPNNELLTEEQLQAWYNYVNTPGYGGTLPQCEKCYTRVEAKDWNDKLDKYICQDCLKNLGSSKELICAECGKSKPDTKYREIWEINYCDDCYNTVKASVPTVYCTDCGYEYDIPGQHYLYTHNNSTLCERCGGQCAEHIID